MNIPKWVGDGYTHLWGGYEEANSVVVSSSPLSNSDDQTVDACESFVAGGYSEGDEERAVVAVEVVAASAHRRGAAEHDRASSPRGRVRVHQQRTLLVATKFVVYELSLSNSSHHQRHSLPSNRFEPLPSQIPHRNCRSPSSSSWLRRRPWWPSLPAGPDPALCERS